CRHDVRAPVSTLAFRRPIPRSGKPTHSRQPSATLLSAGVGGVVLTASVVFVDIREILIFLLFRAQQLHPERLGMATGINAGMAERYFDTLFIQGFLDGNHHTAPAIKELFFRHPERKLQI